MGVKLSHNKGMRYEGFEETARRAVLKSLEKAHGFMHKRMMGYYKGSNSIVPVQNAKM